MTVATELRRISFAPMAWTRCTRPTAAATSLRWRAASGLTVGTRGCWRRRIRGTASRQARRRSNQRRWRRRGNRDQLVHGYRALVAALIIRKAPAHRRFGRKTLGADFVEVVAALGTGVSVILPSLMIGIDQRIVAERRKTFGEAINGVLL